MIRRWLVAVSLLVLVPLHGCTTSDDQTLGGEEAWFQQHAHPLVLEAEHFEDLAFLKPLLEGKRIVQLGENSHGVREYNLLKSRIVRFLHQELGYEVLAFESALYQCYDANLTAAEAPAFSMTRTSTLAGCAFGVWHTEGVLPVFEYLRETQDSDHPLRLTGFDVQPVGNNKADRPDFLSRVVAAIDTTYAADVFSLDSLFLAVYAQGGQARRAYFREESGQRMAEGYDHLASFLAENKDAIEAAATKQEQVLVARQVAASMAAYIRQQAAPTTKAMFEGRDQGMAENLIFLLEKLYPDQKVIVWGHNFHLRHDNLAIPPDTAMYPDVPVRTMGSWIHERYGEAVYTVGLYAYQGQAANNRGNAFDIEPASRESLEGLLHEVGEEVLFIDLSQAGSAREMPWKGAPTTARYNGTNALRMVLRDQYDALLFVDEVSPRVMLY